MSPPSRRLGLIELFEAFAGHLLCCLEMASKLLLIDGDWAAGSAYHSHVPQGAKLTPENGPEHSGHWPVCRVPMYVSTRRHGLLCSFLGVYMLNAEFSHW